MQCLNSPSKLCNKSTCPEKCYIKTAPLCECCKKEPAMKSSNICGDCYNEDSEQPHRHTCIRCAGNRSQPDTDTNTYCPYCGGEQDQAKCDAAYALLSSNTID